VDILRGEFSTKYDEFHLIDCRYPYEYEGGHINGAQNITCVNTIENLFFSRPNDKKIVIVFHCEYSVQRAPQMYVDVHVGLCTFEASIATGTS
jgi:rhodanese-related sulfurtransferase